MQLADYKYVTSGNGHKRGRFSRGVGVPYGVRTGDIPDIFWWKCRQPIDGIRFASILGARKSDSWFFEFEVFGAVRQAMKNTPISSVHAEHVIACNGIGG